MTAQNLHHWRKLSFKSFSKMTVFFCILEAYSSFTLATLDKSWLKPNSAVLLILFAGTFSSFVFYFCSCFLYQSDSHSVPTSWRLTFFNLSIVFINQKTFGTFLISVFPIFRFDLKFIRFKKNQIELNHGKFYYIIKSIFDFFLGRVCTALNHRVDTETALCSFRYFCDF